MAHFSGWYRILVCLIVAVFLVGAAPGQDRQGNVTENAGTGTLSGVAAAALGNLKARSIGPAIMGGRIDDFAVVESNPSIVYAGTASGGIFMTTNAGTTWEPIFDDQAVSSIGALVLAPSDPSILWAGTGESNNRQSSSWGNGIYKSLDAGKTWKHMGLEATHHIGRIVIHPTNPAIVYVAAAGRLWGPSEERGVYKTLDGGRTWSRVLFVNKDTGVSDIAIDPGSPDILYAAAYQRRRTVFGFSGSGPGSAIYRTLDGGATWSKLANGLPYEKGGETGRIGLTVYRGNPNIVYALVEHAAGGIYRSENKGETWTRMSGTNPRPMYYSQVVIDPNNDLRIWVLGAPLYYSEDGGKTFSTSRARSIHSDFHAMWINPGNSDHMILGCDGGIQFSYDAGRSWDYVDTIPLGQFYEIGADMQKPYRVCGGLQDNNTWCGPSATTFARGISNDEWVTVGGGDGFYAQVDPTDRNTVYAESQDGNLLRRNLLSGESRYIRPTEPEGEPRFRFQWNSPVVISAHDPHTIYYAGNFLFKSTDRGDNWSKVSPDLTSGVDRNTLPIMGKVPDKDTLSRHDGVQNWPCITTVSESILNRNVLWAGTDDGNLQVTRDGGATWKNVAGNVPGVPKGTYVSRVIASQHAEATAYVTFDGHRSDDFGVYVYMSADYGETWKNIAAGLPDNNGVVNVIREHGRNRNLLFVGTEYGAYASWDRGGSWAPLKMNLPTVPVDDILIHPRDNDLILGTHGRPIWILDDVTPLEQLTEEVLAADYHLFDVRPATAWRMWSHKSSDGDKAFVAPNPPYGALIRFYLKSKLDEKNRIRISILNKEGKPVREITCGRPAREEPSGRGEPAAGSFGFGGRGSSRCDPKPGVNSVAWDLRENAPMQPVPGEGGGGRSVGSSRGARVDPGEYTVRLSVVGTPAQGSRLKGNSAAAGPAKWESSKPLKVEEDPRITISEADRVARRQALNQLRALTARATQSTRAITGLRANLTKAMEAWKEPGALKIPEDVKSAAEDLLKRIDEIYPQFGTLPSEAQGLGSAGPPLVERPRPLPSRIGRLMYSIDGYTAAPTATQLTEIRTLAKLLPPAAEAVQRLAGEDLTKLNELMRNANIPYISARSSTGSGRRRGPGAEEER